MEGVFGSVLVLRRTLQTRFPHFEPAVGEAQRQEVLAIGLAD